MIIGALEAGGTKFVCGIGNEHGEILDRISFPTEKPEPTIAQAIGYFQSKQIEALGVGSFGPLDLDPDSPNYGHVTTTPKPGWQNYDLLGGLTSALNVPAGFDTDVNAAAFGEAKWGAAQGLGSCVYYTVGTGIGAGVYAEGRLVHGLVHPEGGHVPVRRHPEDRFEGTCPYHKDCLEGMAAGPAIAARWNADGGSLPEDHPAWEMEAHYLAEAVTGAILLLSPKKIILGGGVMHQEQLFPLIRRSVARNLNGYVASAALDDLDSYIVPPVLGDNAGLAGSLALGIEAAGGD
ncbi:ROK family protein [Saccharibacillus sp. CPCC 101409]|uniref:ROK family protein n=1 Tax=Saccharibacillus sp. CPCC 101409 TaxID=3058041 RepID=UPI002671C44B|nr:ROK family protein [Saccharibacillus sp. CPCC 101409]MDO3408481.1 ROK family protein [Saccharibacillus sp. CPCC 101409]